MLRKLNDGLLEKISAGTLVGDIRVNDPEYLRLMDIESACQERVDKFFNSNPEIEQMFEDDLEIYGKLLVFWGKVQKLDSSEITEDSIIELYKKITGFEIQ